MKKVFQLAAALTLAASAFAQTTPATTSKQAIGPTKKPGVKAVTPKGEAKLNNILAKTPKLHEFHPQMPKRIELSNGMVIFLQEDHELPLIDGVARIRGGERDTSAAKVGLIDIYGEAWRTGGTKSKTGDQLDDFLEARAAKIETDGSIDSTNISFSCLKQDFNDVFAEFIDLLQNPEFRQDKIDLAKQQLDTAISRRNDVASDIAAREARKLAYGADNPYARTPEYYTVAAITREDLMALHHKTLHPNNVILGIVGDFDSAQMEASLRQTFEKMPSGPKLQEAKVEFHDPQPAIYVVDKNDVNQSNIDLVTLGTTRDNPDYFAITVMNELFGGGFSSRLFSNVRSKKGLAYSVGGGIGTAFDHPGMFRLVMGTKSGTTIDGIEALHEEVQNLIKDSGSEAEVKRAKDNILNSFVFNFDTKDKVLREQMSYEFYHYPLDFLEQYRTGIEKVTPADVHRVVEKYVAPAKFATLIVGNESDFKSELAKLGNEPVKTIDISIPQEPPAAAGAAKAPAESNAEGKALIAKVAQALGGKDKLAAVKSMETTSSIKSPRGDVEADALVVLPFQTRTAMKSGMGAVTIVATEKGGFMAMGPQSQEIPAAMRESIQQDVKRDLVVVGQHAEDPAYKFAAEGTAQVDGAAAAVLNVDADGAKTKWFVDPQSGRVLRTVQTSMSMQGPAERTADYSDWRPTEGGLTLPFHRAIKQGSETTDITVKEIKVNPAVDPKEFEKPQ
jgi:zinc protease